MGNRTIVHKIIQNTLNIQNFRYENIQYIVNILNRKRMLIWVKRQQAAFLSKKTIVMMRGIIYNKIDWL